MNVCSYADNWCESMWVEDAVVLDEKEKKRIEENIENCSRRNYSGQAPLRLLY